MSIRSEDGRNFVSLEAITRSCSFEQFAPQTLLNATARTHEFAWNAGPVGRILHFDNDPKLPANRALLCVALCFVQLLITRLTQSEMCLSAVGGTCTWLFQNECHPSPIRKLSLYVQTMCNVSSSSLKDVALALWLDTCKSQPIINDWSAVVQGSCLGQTAIDIFM